MHTDSNDAKRQAGSAGRAGNAGRRREDQYGHYSHEMSEETTEATGRALVRVVPMFYGYLLGSLADNLPLWLGLGLMLSVAIDLKMAERSITLPLFRRLSVAVCPLAAAVAQWLSRGIAWFDLRPPTVLRDMQCGAG